MSAATMARPKGTQGPPTARQEAVYDFIRGYSEETGRPPTRREIVEHFGWGGTNAVTCHLTALERKGLITIDRFAARGIRITFDNERDSLLAIVKGWPTDKLRRVVSKNRTT